MSDPSKRIHVNVPGIRAGVTGAQYGRRIILAPPTLDPVPQNLMRRGTVTARLAFPPGVTWFDGIGFTMARAALDTGNLVDIQMADAADARAWVTKLEGKA